MTRLQADSYANWKAPAQDRELLIWPEPSALLGSIAENNLALRQSTAAVQNVSLPAVRQKQRFRLGHENAEQPLLAGGHQTELYHPGVWVKDVLAGALAERVTGRAIHFAVDTDQPKHLNLRWPGVTIPVSDDPALTTAAWSGLIVAPSPRHLSQIGQGLNQLAQQWRFEPLLTRSLALLLSGGASGGAASLSARLTAAQRSIDHELGLSHETKLVGELCGGEPYLLFAHHVLARAADFASDYNAALMEYRQSTGITSPMRPMPDLHFSDEEVEAPFWLDNLASETRQRAAVVRSGSKWAIAWKSDRFVFDRAAEGWAAAESLGRWLEEHRLRFSPRALTLTMFLRLLVVDLFIHGIGGGRYDQVTDLLIERHFGIAPPRFAVTTATMLFPAAVGRSRVCLSCLSQEGHRLRHAALGEKKQQIVAQIDALPRRSLQRSIAFHNLHGCLSAAALSNTALKDWQIRFDAAELQDRQDEILFDRELFYAVQPRERLAEMMGRYEEAFG